MRNEIVSAVVIVLVIASATAGYIVGTSNQHTSTETTTTTSFVSTRATTTITQTTISTLSGVIASMGGLELRASVNATSVEPGQNIGISISLYNPLMGSLNLSTSNTWVVQGFPIAMWGGCNFIEPVEFMIVRGNFSVAELQAASANSTLFPGLMCAEGGSVFYVSFLPTSSNVTTTGSFCTSVCSPYHESWNLSTSFSVNGYWAYPLNSSESNDILTPFTGCNNPPCGIAFNYPEVGPEAQHAFTSGLYTLVVTDEWGQAVLLHFSVV